MYIRPLSKLIFIDFRDYFGRFSIQITRVISTKDASKLQTANLEKKFIIGKKLKNLQDKLGARPSNLESAQTLLKEVNEFIEEYQKHLDDTTAKNLQKLASLYVEYFQEEMEKKDISESSGRMFGSLGFIPASELLPPVPVSEASIAVVQFRVRPPGKERLDVLAKLESLPSPEALKAAIDAANRASTELSLYRISRTEPKKVI